MESRNLESGIWLGISSFFGLTNGTNRCPIVSKLASNLLCCSQIHQVLQERSIHSRYSIEETQYRRDWIQYTMENCKSSNIAMLRTGKPMIFEIEQCIRHYKSYVAFKKHLDTRYKSNIFKGKITVYVCSGPNPVYIMECDSCDIFCFIFII